MQKNLAEADASRTPPGVRELKQVHSTPRISRLGRTPPGVRELKLQQQQPMVEAGEVAPLPGCVN